MKELTQARGQIYNHIRDVKWSVFREQVPKVYRPKGLQSITQAHALIRVNTK